LNLQWVYQVKRTAESLDHCLFCRPDERCRFCGIPIGHREKVLDFFAAESPVIRVVVTEIIAVRGINTAPAILSTERGPEVISNPS
jgi:hypothetical protein